MSRVEYKIGFIRRIIVAFNSYLVIFLTSNLIQHDYYATYKSSLDSVIQWVISKGKGCAVIGLVSVNWQKGIVLCEVVDFFKGRSGDVFGIIILVEKGGHFFGFRFEIFIVGTDTAQASKLGIRN